MILKKLLNYLTSSILDEHWNIGIMKYNKDILYQGLQENSIKWLKHPYHDRWFADPFILTSNDENITLLVEEFCFWNRKGRISKLVIDRNNMCLLHRSTLLELPTHLSFPAIYKENDIIYIYPENSTSGNLSLYIYNEKKDILEKSRILINRPLTDATLLKKDSKYYILSTELPDPNGKTARVYCSDTLTGEYKKIKEIKFNDNVARNGGLIFKDKDDFIRPAQNCNEGYGMGIVLQSVCFSNDEFTFKDIKRLNPIDKKYKNGFHTFNIHENIVAVDGYRYCNHLIRLPFKFLLKNVLLSFRKN